MRPKPISRRMSWVFLISVILMFAHKVECWLLHEWLDSPFFQWLYQSGGIIAENPEDAFGEMVFFAFISWLFAGLFMGFLIMRGGWGPHIALGIWGLTGILEWHHLGKTFVRDEYYGGLGTAMPFLLFMFYYWWELAKQVERLPRRGISFLTDSG